MIQQQESKLNPSRVTPKLVRRAAPARVKPFVFEEVLVVDARSRRTPAEAVEERLFGLMERMFLSVSHFRLSTPCRGRDYCG